MRAIMIRLRNSACGLQLGTKRRRRERGRKREGERESGAGNNSERAHQIGFICLSVSDAPHIPLLSKCKTFVCREIMGCNIRSRWRE